jgi:plastocyanin
MRNKIFSITLCLFFLGSIIAQDMGDNGGTITGTIKVKRLRDARDVVVFLEKVDGKFPLPKEKPVMDQNNMVFVPHVLPLVVGTIVQFPNSDNVRHNVFSRSKTKKFNLGTYAAGVVREVTFDKPGIVNILCNVHTEMSAFIVVLENPYFVLTGPDGKFTIKNVPPGTYKIKAWHEKLREKEKDVTVIDGKTVTIDFKLSR